MRSNEPNSAMAFVAGAVLAVAAMWPATALADDSASKFKAAKALADDGRCDEALPPLQEVWSTSKSPNAALVLARCQRDLGKLGDAYNTFRAARDVALGGKARYRPAAKAAAAEMALIEPRVALLVISTTNSDEVVSLDGQALAGNLRDVPFGVQPGKRAVTFGEGGAAAVVEVDAVVGRAVAVVRPSAKPGAADGGAGWSQLQTIGAITAGVGVVGLAIGGAFGAAAITRFDSLETACEGGCPSDLDSNLADEGRLFETVSYVALGVGGAAVATGVVLIVVGGEDASSMGAIPFVSPTAGGAFFGLSGRF